MCACGEVLLQQKCLWNIVRNTAKVKISIAPLSQQFKRHGPVQGQCTQNPIIGSWCLLLVFVLNTGKLSRCHSATVLKVQAQFCTAIYNTRERRGMIMSRNVSSC